MSSRASPTSSSRPDLREEGLDGRAVEEITGGREIVDLEVAGVHDDALRRLDDQPEARRHRVRDLPRAEGQAGGIDAAAGSQEAVVDAARAVPRVLGDAVLHQRERVRGAVHRHVEVAQEVAHRTDVILVPVGEDQRLDVLLPIDEPLPVGVHDVDPEPPLIEDHAAVEDDDPAVVLDRHAVHPDLAETAERDETNRARHVRSVST
jgi:hypothetical protein